MKIFICLKIPPLAIYIGIFSLIFGFAMTWHIVWLAIVSFDGYHACLIIRLSGKDEHEVITAAQVKEMEAARTRRRSLYESIINNSPQP